MLRVKLDREDPTQLHEQVASEIRRAGQVPLNEVAWKTLAEVCDPNRFVNSKQVAAFCGCDPSLKVSAGNVTSQVRRKGNARLHDALIGAAGNVDGQRLLVKGIDVAADHGSEQAIQCAMLVVRRRKL